MCADTTGWPANVSVAELCVEAVNHRVRSDSSSDAQFASRRFSSSFAQLAQVQNLSSHKISKRLTPQVPRPRRHFLDAEEAIAQQHKMSFSRLLHLLMVLSGSKPLAARPPSVKLSIKALIIPVGRSLSACTRFCRSVFSTLFRCISSSHKGRAFCGHSLESSAVFQRSPPPERIDSSCCLPAMALDGEAF